jgi:hypothetical protein
VRTQELLGTVAVCLTVFGCFSVHECGKYSIAHPAPPKAPCHSTTQLLQGRDDGVAIATCEARAEMRTDNWNGAPRGLVTVRCECTQ